MTAAWSEEAVAPILRPDEAPEEEVAVLRPEEVPGERSATGKAKLPNPELRSKTGGTVAEPVELMPALPGRADATDWGLLEPDGNSPSAVLGEGRDLCI